MNEYLEKYRAIKDADKAIAIILIVAKKDGEEKLYSDTNAGWTIGLVNCQDEMLETLMDDEYQVIEDFDIKEEGLYEIEVVLNFNEEQRSFAPPVQPDFKAYYDVDYFEIVGQHPLDIEEYTESSDMDFKLP